MTPRLGARDAWVLEACGADRRDVDKIGHHRDDCLLRCFRHPVMMEMAACRRAPFWYDDVLARGHAGVTQE
jgi:hypothetical protein